MAYPRKITKETILVTARLVLEKEGELSLRSVARRLRVKPPSLYNYYHSIADLRSALVADAFYLIGAAMSAALARKRSLDSLAHAYRGFAKANPNLYHLVFSPIEDVGRNRAARDEALRPLADVLGLPLTDQRLFKLQRVFWSFAHGLVSLEGAGQFFLATDLDSDYLEGIRSLAVSLRQSPSIKGG